MELSQFLTHQACVSDHDTLQSTADQVHSDFPIALHFVLVLWIYYLTGKTGKFSVRYNTSTHYTRLHKTSTRCSRWQNNMYWDMAVTSILTRNVYNFFCASRHLSVPEILPVTGYPHACKTILAMLQHVRRSGCRIRKTFTDKKYHTYYIP
jgi:hypothetical protein